MVLSTYSTISIKVLNVLQNLTWHANEREIDDKFRHPVDSPTWKLIDTMWPNFIYEPEIFV